MTWHDSVLMAAVGTNNLMVQGLPRKGSWLDTLSILSKPGRTGGPGWVRLSWLAGC